MQATVIYLLSEQAQREMLRNTTSPIPRKVMQTPEVAGDDLDLFDIDEDGKPYLDLTNPGPPRHRHHDALIAAGCERGARSELLIPSADLEIIALIRTGQQKLAEKAEADKRRLEEEETLRHTNGEHNRAVTEAAYQEFLANPAARHLYSSPRSFISDVRSPADWWPDDHTEFRKEIERRQAADRAAKEADEEAKEFSKNVFIGAWIAGNADEETQQQYKDDLLCRDVAIGLIADAAFTAAGVPLAASYNENFCEDRKCPCGVKTFECIPREIYPWWRKVRAQLPEGYQVEFLKVRECLKNVDYREPEDDTAGSPIYLAKITIPEGPFQFTREVELKEELWHAITRVDPDLK